MVEKSKLLSVTRHQIEGTVFFVVFYLYLWRVVDLRLIPSVGGVITKFPVFYKGWNFFYHTCDLPGGFVDYLSDFFVQFFYFSWAGAIVVTLQAWLIYFCTKKFLDSLKMSKFSFVSYTGPIIILVLYNKYMYFFNIASGLLVAFLFAYLYTVLVKGKKKVTSLLVFLLLSVFLYPISGGSLLLFALLCMMYELINCSHLVVAGSELLIALAVAFVSGVYIYDIGIFEALTRLMPVHSNLKFIYLGFSKWTFVACILYLFLPFLSLILWGIQKIPAPGFLSLFRKKSYPAIVPVLGTILFLMLISLPLYFTYDRTNKNVLTADYYASQRNWSKALETAAKEIRCPFMVFIANRALYHMGRLPQDMFSYPQQISAPLYVTNAPPQYFKGLYQGIDFCIELGLMGHAEHFSWENIEKFGPLPEFLKRLAIIKMAKGNMDDVRVYLKTLSKTLFHADWAKKYLVKIETDPTLSSDEYIQNLRNRMLKSDHLQGKGLERWTLMQLLEKNRKNKMAFEYLMALFLLNRQPEGVVNNLYRLPDFDYKETPQVYEEAYFLCLVYKRPVKFPKRFQVSPESKKRFDSLDQFMRKYGTDSYSVEREVTTNFKNTYYEYFFYGYKHNLHSTRGGEK